MPLRSRNASESYSGEVHLGSALVAVAHPVAILFLHGVLGSAMGRGGTRSRSNRGNPAHRSWEGQSAHRRAHRAGRARSQQPHVGPIRPLAARGQKGKGGKGKHVEPRRQRRQRQLADNVRVAILRARAITDEVASRASSSHSRVPPWRDTVDTVDTVTIDDDDDAAEAEAERWRRAAPKPMPAAMARRIARIAKGEDKGNKGIVPAFLKGKGKGNPQGGERDAAGEEEEMKDKKEKKKDPAEEDDGDDGQVQYPWEGEDEEDEADEDTAQEAAAGEDDAAQEAASEHVIVISEDVIIWDAAQDAQEGEEEEYDEEEEAEEAEESDAADAAQDAEGLVQRAERAVVLAEASHDAFVATIRAHAHEGQEDDHKDFDLLAQRLAIQQRDALQKEFDEMGNSFWL